MQDDILARRRALRRQAVGLQDWRWRSSILLPFSHEEYFADLAQLVIDDAMLSDLRNQLNRIVARLECFETSSPVARVGAALQSLCPMADATGRLLK